MLLILCPLYPFSPRIEVIMRNAVKVFLISCIAVFLETPLYSQRFEINEESNDAIQKVVSLGKNLVDDFEIGLGSYLSIVEGRFTSSPTSQRLFESKARLERFKKAGVVVLSNVWETEDLDDLRSDFEKTKSIPSYKNCSSRILIVDSKIFEIVDTQDLGIDGKPMQARLTKRNPDAVECGFGVDIGDWPFIMETCFSVRFACRNLLADQFGRRSKCLAVIDRGKSLDSIWTGPESKPGRTNVISRIVFDDEVPVLFEMHFSEAGYSTRPGVVKLDKSERATSVRTRWKEFDLFKVPEKIDAVFFAHGGSDGFTELNVDIKLKFFPAESKEFKAAEEAANKLAERARKLAASNKLRE